MDGELLLDQLYRGEDGWLSLPDKSGEASKDGIDVRFRGSDEGEGLDERDDGDKAGVKYESVEPKALVNSEFSGECRGVEEKEFVWVRGGRVHTEEGAGR